MFKNYLIVAFRNFWRKKVFSVINIAGLAIGISAALVIYLIVHYEFSYEKFQRDRGRVYRIVTNMHFPDQDFKNAGVPGPLPPAVRSEIPGIEKSTVFWAGNAMKTLVPEGENKKEFKKHEDIIYADEYYFRFFDYQWIAGSPDNSLTRPNTVVLAESQARSYFPFVDISNAIGKTIVYDDSIPATVTGIVKDLNQITDFTFKEFISLSTVSERLKRENGYGEWGSVTSSYQFFVKLAKNIDTAQVNKELAIVRKKNEKNAYLSTEHFHFSF